MTDVRSLECQDVPTEVFVLPSIRTERMVKFTPHSAYIGVFNMDGVALEFLSFKPQSNVVT